jgi:NAD(P)-dependent dehydrogenase (short-subunit alcohol dehydrogenase family)
MIDGATEGTPQLRQFIDRVVPLGRIATVEEVTNVIVFLTSPNALHDRCRMRH